MKMKKQKLQISYSSEYYNVIVFRRSGFFDTDDRNCFNGWHEWSFIEIWRSNKKDLKIAWKTNGHNLMVGFDTREI